MLVVLQTLSAGKLSSYMNKFQVNATLKDLCLVWLAGGWADLAWEENTVGSLAAGWTDLAREKNTVAGWLKLPGEQGINFSWY